MKQSIVVKVLLILSAVTIVIYAASSYLFSQNDEKLIGEIRDYNFNQAMQALDARQEDRLKLNKELMQDTINMIAKNSSSFLLNFNKDGLRKSLHFDMQKEGIKAIVVWDDVLNENFLTAVKQQGDIHFQDQIPQQYEKFTQIQKVIFDTSDGLTEQIGNITLFYDESIITNQIASLKRNTKESIDSFNQAIDKRLHDSNLIQSMIEIGSFLTILILTSLLLIRFVNKPLKTLETGLSEFFSFLQNRTAHPKPIELYSKDEFGFMAKSLNENIAVSAKLHEEIHELNTNLEKRIQQKTEKVTSLLNNADQGFLSFGEDLVIDDEYSKQCTAIFKQDIAGLNIGDLLHGNSHKKAFFAETLQSLLKETNPLKIKTIISLLPREFIINRKAIEVKYKLISNEKFMLILTDVTSNKILQKKIDKERNILKMIVAVVGDTEEFFELCDEYNEMSLSKETLIASDKTALHNATELYRTIHTFKGLFAQKEMASIVANLHNLESQLSEAIAKQSYDNAQLTFLIMNTDFNAWLQKDLDLIKEVLGNDIFHKKGEITIQEESVSEIEEKIIAIAKEHDELDEYAMVVNEIRNLKNRPLYTLFNSYPKLVDQLSHRLNKSIYPLKIISDKEIKSNDSIKPFVKSLIHVFRNAVDHGIETMDERLELDKDEIGTITCSIAKNNDKLHIVIADDGSGLNLLQIQRKAEQAGMDTSQMTQSEIEALIFNDRLSTKQEVDQISGRGVGMAVVKEEISRLNGEIKINSKENQGTTFEFVIPL